MFQSNIAKGVLSATAIAALFVGFVIFNLNGETKICADNGFGKYNDSLGRCEAIDGANNLIIVTGNTSNSPKPAVDKDSDTYKFIKNSVANHANVKVISVAGDMPVTKVDIKENETNDASGFVESINTAISEMSQQFVKKPEGDGATYLEAISKAGRDVVSSKTGNAAIIVIGSGLSDGGSLNFACDELLSRETYEIVDAMKDARQLNKNLDGVDIIWYGIGQTVAPQERLSEADVEKLKDIYKTILEAKGATVQFDDTSMGLVSIEENSYKVKPTRPSNPELSLPSTDFSTEELGFKGDDSKITDENTAKDALSEAINYYKTYPHKSLIVTGYMAPNKCLSEVDKVDTTLAGLRAETVKDFLKKNGVTNPITTRNGGIFDREKDACNGGLLTEDLMAYRRKVTIEIQ